ncbi:hypothetical protein GW17_00033053 [Ensete ventricosum]|nr:hypothetical protein GW17_00033053 [Ensete ventricosum]
MEGWLQLVRCNRLGLHYTRKRYFVLEGNALNCYKGVPASDREVLGAPPPRIPPLISWFFLSYSFQYRLLKHLFMQFSLTSIIISRLNHRNVRSRMHSIDVDSPTKVSISLQKRHDHGFLGELKKNSKFLSIGMIIQFYHELINTFLKFRTVILYHSVIHYKCQPERGYVRACLKSNVKANTTLMQMVAADWMKSDKREDNLGSRTGGIVQLIRCLNVNIQLAIDVGSSSIAKGVVSLVVGYLNSLVIEMAFLIQGDTQEELPEVLLGTCRLNHLDISQAVWISSW